MFSLASLAVVLASHIIGMGNALVHRDIDISDGHLTTSSYTINGNDTQFILPQSAEFSFMIDRRSYSGLSDWKEINVKEGADSVTVNLKNPERRLELDVVYRVYPDSPAISKKLIIKNTSRHRKMCLEAVDVESLSVTLSPIESWVMRNYGRYREISQYVGDWNDPLIVIHDNSKDCGMAIGNETTGILKRISVFGDGHSVSAGLTHPDQTYPFRKWLGPGEQWESPAVFTILYADCRDPYKVINTSVADYVRKHMGVRVEQIEHKPMCVYNTWNPFMHDINEKLICELADAAAECGIEEFVIDDGWEMNIDTEHPEQFLGDWETDTLKFPHGLKPVFDHIKELGMKPGLWISLATADKSSKVYRENPEWFVKGKDGKAADLHNDDSHSCTACFGTAWYGYIRDKILKMNREYGLAYVKLDLSILASAYVWDSTRTGCYAKNHHGHRDHQESYWVIYNNCMQLFDELHREAPDMFIDCTFETAGKFQLMDYGIALHAEGNWLSNVCQSAPVGSLKIRNFAWGRCPVLPATSLVIGNLRMEDERFDLNIKSLAGTLPILLGDPRLLSKEQRREFRSWADWLRKMEEKHSYMSFRQDLPGFGEPQEGCWDGWSRINTDTCSGGLVGVFRQGAAESSRTVSVSCLDPDATYVVRKGFDGTEVITANGKELSEKGFTVTLPREYDGELFEITLQ